MLKKAIQATVDGVLVLAGVFALIFNTAPTPRPAPLSESIVPQTTAAVPPVSPAPATNASAAPEAEVTGSIPARDRTTSAALGPAAPAANTGACSDNPNALGVSRVVEVDTTGGPGFGGEHFKGMDFLRPVQKVEYTFKDEIEKGISAVSWATGGSIAPFFRFPGLRQPPEGLAYLGGRNIAVFSADFDSFDFKLHRPEQVRQSVMAKLKKQGKGIILMHDFQHSTADAIAGILDDLKAGGYKVVQMRARDRLNTLPEYDALVMKNIATPNVSSRAVESVVRTVDGN
jgi:hypothetical protein